MSLAQSNKRCRCRLEWLFLVCSSRECNTWCDSGFDVAAFRRIVREAADTTATAVVLPPPGCLQGQSSEGPLSTANCETPPSQRTTLSRILPHTTTMLSLLRLRTRRAFPRSSPRRSGGENCHPRPTTAPQRRPPTPPPLPPRNSQRVITSSNSNNQTRLLLPAVMMLSAAVSHHRRLRRLRRPAR